jgi:hypothetical protein
MSRDSFYRTTFWIAVILSTCTAVARPKQIEAASFALGAWHKMVYHEQVEQVVLVNGGPENGKSPDDYVELWSWMMRNGLD